MEKAFLKVVLKTKNEEDLIEPWLLYYSKIVGWDNIIVFDNNSDSEKVKNIYKKYSIKPIVWDDDPNYLHFYKPLASSNHNRCEEFYETIINTSKYFTLLDTDEFLSVYDEEKQIFTNNIIKHIEENERFDAIGSVWLQNMYVKDSIEYFKIQSGQELEHNRNYGKGIYKTGSINFKKFIYGHNICFKEGMNISEDLFCLHLDRTNPEVRIRNCIDMAIGKKSLHKNCDGLLEALKSLKEKGVVEEGLLNCSFDYHKLREIKSYYTNREEYLLKHYSFDEKNYIRTNIINFVTKNEEYKQEIKNESNLKLAFKTRNAS